MNEEVRSLMAKVLYEGLDDWVVLDSVVQRALFPSKADRLRAKNMALTALSILLKNGLVIEGRLGDSGFEAWDLNPEQALDRIRIECETKNGVSTS